MFSASSLLQARLATHSPSQTRRSSTDHGVAATAAAAAASASSPPACTLVASPMSSFDDDDTDDLPLPSAAAAAEALPMLSDDDEDDDDTLDEGEAVPPPPPNVLLSAFDDFGEPPPPPPDEAVDEFVQVGSADAAAPPSSSSSSVVAPPKLTVPLDDQVSSLTPTPREDDPFKGMHTRAPAASSARPPIPARSSTLSAALLLSPAAHSAAASAAAANAASAAAASSIASPVSSPSPQSAAENNSAPSSRQLRTTSSSASSPFFPATQQQSYSPSASASSPLSSFSMPSALSPSGGGGGGSSSAASATTLNMSFDDDILGSQASMLTSASDLGSSKSFASSLTHNFPGVSQQVEIGSYAAKRVASFLKKLAFAQDEYAKTVQKLLAHEQAKLPKLAHDGMRLSTKTWTQFQEQFAKLAKSHLAESQEVSQTIAAPLMDFHVQQEERRKEILVEERKNSLEMSRAREEVTKNLGLTMKLLDEARKLQQEAKELKKASMTGGASGSGGGVGFFKTLSMKVGKKPEVVIKEASKAAALYQASILNANRRQTRYIETELPKLFNDMQLLEKRRMEVVKTRLVKFHATTALYAQERAGIMESIKTTVEQINAPQDIHQFIQDQLWEQGQPIAPRAFTYDLPCTVNDIDAGRLEGNPNSIFRSTVDHCMDLQTKLASAPNADAGAIAAGRLDIPRIVPALINRIKELGGHTELGIFRISVGKEDLDALRKQLDTDNNYNLSNIKNAHICAALLKEWVRLLADPLIPTEQFYAPALESVKSTTPGISGGAHASQAGVDNDAIMRLYEALPPVNQRVLKALSIMVKELATPANAEISKMSVDNLAIVFAPSFLRNPSEDPAIIMANTKFETKFTANLFRVVGEITDA